MRAALGLLAPLVSSLLLAGCVEPPGATTAPATDAGLGLTPQAKPAPETEA